MKTFDDDIVSGSVFRSVWKLAWPVALLQLVSGMHGFVDQILVGHYVGYEGNAGVGVAWQLFLVILVSLNSLFHGMGIVIARYAGRKDADQVNRVAYEVFLAAVFILIFVVAPVGYFLSPYMLSWVNAQPEVVAHGLPYLQILFVASAPVFLMFLVNGAFVAAGDPRTPLLLGILTTAVNVLASYLLIAGPGPFPELGAAGAAIGTCIGPLPSVVIAIVLVMRGKSIIGPPKRYSIIPDRSVIRLVGRIGIPAGIQAVFLNLGGAFLIGYIGTLAESAAAQAAYTICYAQLFSFITWTGFGLRGAAATVMGQNIGAGKTQRGIQSVYVTAGIGAVWAIAFGLVYWTIPGALLGLFDVAEGAVLEYGTTFLRYLSFSGVFVLMALAFTGGLQGAGDTKKPMFIAFVTQIVILLGICAVFAGMDRLTAEVIWGAVLVSHLSRLILSYVVFRGGKWASISVELDA